MSPGCRRALLTLCGLRPGRGEAEEAQLTGPAREPCSALLCRLWHTHTPCSHSHPHWSLTLMSFHRHVCLHWGTQGLLTLRCPIHLHSVACDLPGCGGRPAQGHSAPQARPAPPCTLWTQPVPQPAQAPPACLEVPHVSALWPTGTGCRDPGPPSVCAEEEFPHWPRLAQDSLASLTRHLTLSPSLPGSQSEAGLSAPCYRKGAGPAAHLPGGRGRAQRPIL